MANKPTTHKRTQTVFCIMFVMIWAVAAVTASQLLIGHIMATLLGASAFIRPAITAIYSVLSYSLALVITFYIPRKLLIKWGVPISTKKSYRKLLGLQGWPTWTDIGLAPVAFVAYTILATLIVQLFTLFPWFDAAQAQDVGFNYFTSGFDRTIAFFTLVVIAPIVEEIIFRGWLYGILRNRTSTVVSNVASMIISSLIVSILFGIVHMQWNVGVNVFALSLILCGLREITNTIYAGILLHMLKNGIAFWLIYMV